MHIPILKIYGCLLISFVHDLSDEQIEAVHTAALNRIKNEEIAGLLLDVTGLDLIDSFMARSLDDLGIAAKAMGCRTVIAGLKPAIAMTLVEMGIELDHLVPVLNVDAGLSILQAASVRRMSGGQQLSSKQLAERRINEQIQGKQQKILENYLSLNPHKASKASPSWPAKEAP